MEKLISEFRRSLSSDVIHNTVWAIANHYDNALTENLEVEYSDAVSRIYDIEKSIKESKKTDLDIASSLLDKGYSQIEASEYTDFVKKYFEKNKYL